MTLALSPREARAPSRTDAAPSRTDAVPSRTDAAPSRTDAAPSRTDAATHIDTNRRATPRAAACGRRQLHGRRYLL
eukprot:3529619-Prymnesium_polylepis.1